MRDFDVLDLVQGYKERMKRIALFEPLYDLERMQQKDKKGTLLPMKDFGLLMLLFFYEHKLMRSQKVGVVDVAEFLQKIVGNRFSLELEDYETITRKLLNTFRPSIGKKRTVQFYNWETKLEEEVQFSYIRDNDFKGGIQYYTLDEDGLELLFATREFYSEFQLSIHQLMLRKQLEKGEFKGALRQINEMRIDVETLVDRVEKIEQEIKRNIVSDETFARYETLLDDIYSRLSRENNEFVELTSFVNETRNHLYYEDTDKKERQAYRFLLQISKELELVHAEHGALLNKSIHLKNTALKAAQDSLYLAGVDTFNFNQDLTARVLNKPAAIETLKGLAAPFTNLEQVQVWSPLVLFEKQVITKADDEKEEQRVFLEHNEDEKQHSYSEQQRVKYQEFMLLLLDWYEKSLNHELTSFLAYLQAEKKSVLHERIFYEFLLVLHQRSPLKQEESDGEEQAKYVLSDALALLDKRKLIVRDLSGAPLEVTERYFIQNMYFLLEE